MKSIERADSCVRAACIWIAENGPTTAAQIGAHFQCDMSWAHRIVERLLREGLIREDKFATTVQQPKATKKFGVGRHAMQYVRTDKAIGEVKKSRETIEVERKLAAPPDIAAVMQQWRAA